MQSLPQPRAQRQMACVSTKTALSFYPYRNQIRNIKMLHTTTAKVGLCTLELYLPESQSLKDKRAVVKSLLKRLTNTFNVSAAEIDKLDKWQVSVIAFSVVSNEVKQSERVLNRAVEFIESNYPQVHIISEQIEIL